MQVRRLVLCIFMIMLAVTGITYVAADYLPVVATPAATMLPKKPEEKPVFLFALGDGERGRLKNPIAVAADNAGHIYVTDAGDYNVKVFLPNGRLSGSFGRKGTGNSGFGYPYGIAVLKNGDIAVADSVNLNIRVFSETGKYKKTLIDSKQKIRPGAVTVDGKGQIYVSDLLNHQVVVLTGEGKIVRKIKPALASLKYPQEIAVSPGSQGIWVADSGNFAVKSIDDDGQVTAVINSRGNPPQAFSLVRGIALDPLNRLMIADTINGSIRVFSAAGREIFSFDGKDTPSGGFMYPSYICTDHTGKIFVADRGTGLVQVWGYSQTARS